MKRQNDRILKEELPRSVGAQYATGDQGRINSRKNEEMQPKQKQHPVVDVTSDGSKVLEAVLSFGQWLSGTDSGPRQQEAEAKPGSDSDTPARWPHEQYEKAKR